MALTKKQKYDKKYYVENREEILERKKAVRRAEMKKKLSAWFTKQKKVVTGKLGRKNV